MINLIQFIGEGEELVRAVFPLNWSPPVWSPLMKSILFLRPVCRFMWPEVLLHTKEPPPSPYPRLVVFVLFLKTGGLQWLGQQTDHLIWMVWWWKLGGCLLTPRGELEGDFETFIEGRALQKTSTSMVLQRGWGNSLDPILNVWSHPIGILGAC